MKPAPSGGIERTRGRRRAGVVIALSVAAHLLVLSLIGFNAPRLRFAVIPESPALNVWLTPRLDRLAEARRQSRASPLPLSASNTARALVAAPAPPAQQAARAATPSPPSSPASQGVAAASIPGGDVDAGVRAALRGRVGCDVQGVARLTADEKALCSQHMAETAKLGAAYVDPVPAEKRAYYDAVQAAYQAQHDPRPGQLTDIGGSYMAWGHMPALGCTGRPRNDHRSFKEKLQESGVLGVPLGPLSCGVVLPQGSLTPEVGIPHP